MRHEDRMRSHSFRPRRSVLYVPAASERALAKVASLACDAVILDLEDAVAPGEKAGARESLRRFFAGAPPRRQEAVIRINALSSEWGREDLMVARGCCPDAILVPKVEGLRDVMQVAEALDETDAPAALRLWAMMETPRGLLDAGAIADLGREEAARLDCLVAGTNDLARDTRVALTPDRRYLQPWLMQMVLAARAGGLDVLDGVSNDFRDLEAFASECAQARAMGFDGKTLIHPAQIGAANAAFTPAPGEIEEARAIIAAFARPENAGRGVISLNGRMVERLHLEEAEKLLAKANTSEEGAR